MSLTFAALQNKHYRWLLCGNIAQFFAIAARMMICNLLAWQLTGAEISFAYINLALATPMFIGSLVAGPFVDRLERKRLITIGLIVIVLSECSVLLALILNQLQFAHLLLITFISGCVHPFVHPSSIAMMYGFLGKPKIANGIALLSSGMNLSRILGPAVTGGVLALYSPSAAYAMVTLLFFIALVCQLQLPTNKPTQLHHESIANEIRKGLRYLVQDRNIALCLLMSLPSLMLLMSVQYLLVLFATEVWQVGEVGLGILLTAMGIGAFLGALGVARFGSSVSKMKLMFVAALVSAGCFAAFSQSPNFLMGIIALVFANMSAAMALVTNQVVIQLLAKDEVRGRVSGYILMTHSLAPLALFPLSLLAEKIGVDNAVALAAGVVVLLILLFFTLFKRWRDIDSQL